MWCLHNAHGKNMCDLLYYGEVKKKMINAQSHRTKSVMEDFYKRRARQTGMSVGHIKLCYENKNKNKNKNKVKW